MNETILDERELLRREKEYVRQLKGGEHSSEELFGLALSGGGIRSASFALGVLQAMANQNLIEKLDYMSTVSGGGYTGSCLSWFLNKIYHAQNSTANYSIGEKGLGVRSSGINNVLSYLRQHGNYLTPGQGLDIVSFAGVVIRSMFLGFLVYFPLLIGFFNALTTLKLLIPAPEVFAPNFLPWQIAAQPRDYSLLIISFALIIILMLTSIIYSLATARLGHKKFRSYALRTSFQKMSGLLIKFFVLFLVVGTMPMVAAYLGKTIAALGSGSISILGALGAILKLREEQNPAKTGKANSSAFRPVLAALLLIYGLLMGSYLIAGYIAPLVLLFVVSLAVLVGGLVNLNYVSLHRVYRDRLMEMFLPDLAAIKSGEWQPAREANTKPLADFRIEPTAAAQKKFIGPFHIINANLIQIDAAKAKFRGRGGDNFILTPLYCGSNATGWCPTTAFNNGAMTLASAMAISGAAVNPHTGSSGRGVTRNWLVSFLMSFFNFSLGYWARNPKKNKPDRKLPAPNYFCPGILQGLLGLDFSENSSFIELSDGGHFENLALYELIRRRVKTIIVSDGGADPDFNFADLADLVEKVRVDFGVEIDFTATKKPLGDLLPNSAKDNSQYGAKYHLAKSGYATGTIRYPEVKSTGTVKLEGQIIYLKTTLTEDLPEDIYGYKSANPTFPDQSTADQFFDETQFEAYRELGYQLSKKMLGENKKLVKTKQTLW